VTGTEEPWLRIAVARGGAVLVVGERQRPAAEAAGRLARAALCGSPVDATACGTCLDCRWTERGSHPDLRRLEPQGRQIRIDDVRDAVAWTATPPQHSRRRVVLIAAADLLGREAEVALLKSMEEPPAGLMWVLGSDRPGQLSPALRSRCMAVVAPPVGSPAEEQPEGSAADWLAASALAETEAADPAAAVVAARHRLRAQLCRGEVSGQEAAWRWRAIAAAEAAIARGANARLVAEALRRAEVEGIARRGR
jgi:DNA polymerase-3 subunit delta'